MVTLKERVTRAQRSRGQCDTIHSGLHAVPLVHTSGCRVFQPLSDQEEHGAGSVKVQHSVLYSFDPTCPLAVCQQVKSC